MSSRSPSYCKFTTAQKTEISLRKANGCCVICGKKFDFSRDKLVSEHLIPLFIAGWGTFDEQEQNDLISLLRSEANVGIVHHHCNANKGIVFPVTEDLYLTDEAKAGFDSLIDHISPVAHNAYVNLETIRKRQQNTCFICGKKLCSAYTLRRKDSNFPRSLDNACCLHDTCNHLAVRVDGILTKKWKAKKMLASNT